MFSNWIVVIVGAAIVIGCVALGFMLVGVPRASSPAPHKGKRNIKANFKKPTGKRSGKRSKKPKSKQPGSKLA
jgi:hypothetical protein